MTSYIKVSSYIAQYPILRIAQSALYYTISTSLGSIQPYTTMNARRYLVHIHPPLPIARYSCIQLSELEQSSVNKVTQGLNTAAHDWNTGPLSRESDDRPFSDNTVQRRFTGQITGNVIWICNTSVYVGSRKVIQYCL